MDFVVTHCHNTDETRWHQVARPGSVLPAERGYRHTESSFCDSVGHGKTELVAKLSSPDSTRLGFDSRPGHEISHRLFDPNNPESTGTVSTPERVEVTTAEPRSPRDAKRLPATDGLLGAADEIVIV